MPGLSRNTTRICALLKAPKSSMSLPADREPKPAPCEPPTRHRRRQLVPLAIVAVIAIAAIAMGWHRQISIETLIRHRAAIEGFISAHQIAALATYFLLYIVVTAISIPGGAILTISGGILFGTLVGGVLAVLSATIGATIVFLIATSAIGEFLTRRAGGLTRKVTQGFRQDAFTYLLFLRLVPLFPFWLVNIVPALCGVRLATYVSATAIGIVPGTFAFAFFGAGLDSAMAAEETAFKACIAAGQAACSLHFDLRAAATPQLVIGLVALGIIALAPIAVKRFKARRMPKAE
jgi:uncharacterized membrane protein YdjX (TVP38/TMEM64 family)